MKKIKVIIKQVGAFSPYVFKSTEKKDKNGDQIPPKDISMKNVLKVYDNKGKEIGYVTSAEHANLSSGSLYIECLITDKDIIKEIEDGK